MAVGVFPLRAALRCAGSYSGGDHPDYFSAVPALIKLESLRFPSGSMKVTSIPIK